MKSFQNHASRIVILLVCAALTASSVSCSSGQDRTSELAFEYYSSMESRLDILLEKLDEFNSALRSMDSERITGRLDTLKSLVTRIADDINQLEPFEGNAVLRDTFLDNIEFYETLIHDDYPAMADYVINAGSYPMAEVSAFNRKFLEKLNSVAPALEEEVRKAHEHFVIKYKLKDWAEKRKLLQSSGSDGVDFKQYEYLESNGLSSERERYRKQRQILEEYKEM